jgi:hypothetical protein
MKQIASSFSIIFVIMLAVESPVSAQDMKTDKQHKETFSIHVRALTESERVFRKGTTELSTVLDAVGSLKPLPEGLLKMDLWIVRLGKNGKAQILGIDWAGITQRGRTETNFEILPGDRLIIQARLPK